MGTVIAFLNMKGGVGKTTVAVNFAYYLSMRRTKRILTIDLDPQYNATQYFVDIDRYQEYVDGTKPTAFDIIASEGFTYRSIVNGQKKRQTKDKLALKDVARNLWNGADGARLDLIPGTIHLINLEMAGRGIEHKLQRFVAKVKDAYDFILIDCPPTFSIFLLSGILASDYYLVPVKPDPLSVLGVPLLESVIDYYSETYGLKLEPLGVLFTMVRSTSMMRNVMDGLKETSIGRRYIFENHLRNSTYYADASKKHIPLFKHYWARYYGHSDDVDRAVDEFLHFFKK